MLKVGIVLTAFTSATPLLLSGLAHLSATAQPGGQPSSAALTDIPASYLALYQQATQTLCPRLPWNVLAAVGKTESDHGRSQQPGVHSGHNAHGAMGPMQFKASTWAEYGRDGDNDGRANVYDPADAIPAAAAMLCADGARDGTEAGIRKALFAYNHATWYVDHVLTIAAGYAAPTTTQIAATVLSYAAAQLGKPYLWGGTGPDAFDCSGLTMRAYQAAGITLPRRSEEQWGLPHVPPGQEQPGDLAFYHMGPEGPGHVALVVDPSRDLGIEAPHTGDVVKYFNYRTEAIGYTRPATPTK